MIVVNVSRGALPLIIAVSMSAAWGATGTIEVRVRDSITHIGVQATVKLDGPELLTFSTDRTGHFKREVTAGQYREEYSAPGYKTLGSYHTVDPGKVTPLGAYLDPETPPQEERPEAIAPKLRQGYTLLHGYVVDKDTDEPIADVKVRVVKADVATETDFRGHYTLSVPTPASPAPGGAGTDTLVYEKPGYKTEVLKNFLITDVDMGPDAHGLEKGSGVKNVDATHKMFREQGKDIPLVEREQNPPPGCTYSS